VAQYGSVVLKALQEVETTLTNENLYAQQFEHLLTSFRDYTESVRIATIKYKAGTYDMQQVLQLQTTQLSVESDVIKVQNARIANRINLHLALGGSFDAAPAIVPIK
jgi:multidrug efflux system outer membrane protein